MATVDRCETVDAMRGEIRGRPWAAQALYPRAPFHEGDTMWILARNLEEGYFQLWYRGAVRDDLATSVHLPPAQRLPDPVGGVLAPVRGAARAGVLGRDTDQVRHSRLEQTTSGLQRPRRLLRAFR